MLKTVIFNMIKRNL